MVDCKEDEALAFSREEETNGMCSSDACHSPIVRTKNYSLGRIETYAEWIEIRNMTSTTQQGKGQNSVDEHWFLPFREEWRIAWSTSSFGEVQACLWWHLHSKARTPFFKAEATDRVLSQAFIMPEPWPRQETQESYDAQRSRRRRTNRGGHVMNMRRYVNQCESSMIIIDLIKFNHHWSVRVEIWSYPSGLWDAPGLRWLGRVWLGSNGGWVFGVLATPSELRGETP